MNKLYLIVVLVFTIFFGCKKSSSDTSSTGTKSYKVVAEVDCPFNQQVQDISSYDTYVGFDSPTFTPKANTWYKNTENLYFKIGADATPKSQMSQRILISKHYTTYCQ